MNKYENDVESSYEANRKIRKDWGEISPVTRIIPNKKHDKVKKELRKEMMDYEET